MISYLVTVCNEHEEVQNLLESLIDSKDDSEEIVVLFDAINGTEEVRDVLDQYENDIRVIEHPFTGNFAEFKNFGNKQCTKEWIMQLDADEQIDPWIQQSLQDLCSMNDNADLILFPRANTVDGITSDHIRKWNWQVSKSELSIGAKSLEEGSKELEFLRELEYVIHEQDSPDKDNHKLITYYQPLINFPDWQGRLYKNRKEIEWQGKVHEKVGGVKSYAYLPDTFIYSIKHPKTVGRQEKQNQLYENLR